MPQPNAAHAQPAPLGPVPSGLAESPAEEASPESVEAAAPTEPQSLTIEIVAMTHRGRVRDHNEDSVGLAGWVLRSDLGAPLILRRTVEVGETVVVCDGMGGHAAGEVASALAAEHLSAPLTGARDRAALTQRVADTSTRVVEDGRANLERADMGTTAVGVHLRADGSGLVFNVGDARCYRLEGEHLAMLTVDHRNPVSGGLTQVVGGGVVVEPDPAFFDVELDDRGLILCTDGLTDYAEEHVIHEEFLAESVDRTLVERLVVRALTGGGGDNVTVVHVRRILPAQSEGENR